MKPVSRRTAIFPEGIVDTEDWLKENAFPLTIILSSGTLHRPRACLANLGWSVICENSARCSEMRNVPGDVSSRSDVRSRRTSKEGLELGFCVKMLVSGVWPSPELGPKAPSIALLIGDRFVSSKERPMMPTAPWLKKLNPSAVAALMNAGVVLGLRHVTRLNGDATLIWNRILTQSQRAEDHRPLGLSNTVKFSGSQSRSVCKLE